MAHTYEELKKMTVAQLKDIAKDLEHEAVQGYTQMNKANLLEAVCAALGVDTQVHKVAKGIDKSSLKKQIRELKKERDKALEAKDRAQLKAVRQQIKGLRKQLRKAAVTA